VTVEAALMASFIFEEGDPMHGLDLTDDELIEQAQQRGRERPLVVLREWMILDVMLSSELEDQVKVMGCEPAVVFAKSIVYDSRSGASRTGAIRSSFRVTSEQSMFSTRETDYLLAGVGVRKYVSLPAILALDDL